MKFLTLILILQFVANVLAQDIASVADNVTESALIITETDPIVNKTVVKFDDETALNDTEDLSISEAVPPPVNTRHDLDHRLRTFLDSAKDVMTETRHVFNEELNASDSDSEAKALWIAYSKSWSRVFEALIKDVMNKVMSSESESDTELDVSFDCVGSLLDIMGGLRMQRSWAVELFDSSGRLFPEGSLDGTITSLGAYDQCLAIDRNPMLGEANNFLGQYCVVKYKLPLPRKPDRLKLRTKIFNFTGTAVEGTFLDKFSGSAHAFYERWGRTGVCVPSTCTQRDLQMLVTRVASNKHLNLTVADCHTRVLPTLTTLQTTIVAVLATIFALMVVSTSLDLIIAYTKDADRRFIRVESPVRKLLAATLLSFSVYTNGKNLFGESGAAQSQIKCLNGIRVMSMIWILWTHTYLIPIKETFTFVREFMFAVEELGFQLILNGWVLVDTFFLVGAMLSTYSTLHRMSRTSGQINIPQQILNRFFRIWPSLVLTVGLIFLIPSLTTGPLWKEYFNVQLDKCHKNWWTTLSFINNYFPESQMCLLHTWYLSADFQLFIISFFFIVPLYKKPSLGIKLIILFIVGSALIVGIRTYLMEQNPTVLYNTPNERDVYDQTSTIYVHTYIHLGPYFVGLVLGHLVFKHRTVKLNPLLNLAIWLLALSGCLSIMLSTYTLNRGELWPPLNGALYAGLHRIGWSLCVAWIVFGCATGNGGPINTFLSWNLFVPMAKLSFSVYLVHFLVIWVRYAYGRQPLPFSHYTMFCQFIVNLVISTAVSVVTHLAVEAPLLALYRLYLSNRFEFLALSFTKESAKDVNKQMNDSGIIITSKL